MTRINVIPPENLTDQHLLAEYRELPRVFALARDLRPGERAVPAYTLGAGHVKFFYARTTFLHRRQRAIIREALARGFKVQHTEPPPPIPGLDGDWRPDPAAVSENLGRLRARLAERPNFHTHRGAPAAANFYEVTP